MNQLIAERMLTVVQLTNAVLDKHETGELQGLGDDLAAGLAKGRDNLSALLEGNAHKAEEKLEQAQRWRNECTALPNLQQLLGFNEKPKAQAENGVHPDDGEQGKLEELTERLAEVAGVDYAKILLLDDVEFRFNTDTAQFERLDGEPAELSVEEFRLLEEQLHRMETAPDRIYRVGEVEFRYNRETELFERLDGQEAELTETELTCLQELHDAGQVEAVEAQQTEDSAPGAADPGQQGQEAAGNVWSTKPPMPPGVRAGLVEAIQAGSTPKAAVKAVAKMKELGLSEFEVGAHLEQLKAEGVVYQEGKHWLADPDRRAPVEAPAPNSADPDVVATSETPDQALVAPADGQAEASKPKRGRKKAEALAGAGGEA